MRIPEKLATLADYGIIQEVVRPLMSGKEAEVYLVVSGGAYRVAKIYKDAAHRSFKNRSEYTEGRQVRNSRDQRAMTKRSARGRAQEEEAWRSAEADIIHRLHAVGVRVPVPHHFIDGVLVMELILDADGHPAPRLGDVVMSPEEAVAIHGRLLREVVRMLCAGVVHGDLSEFNVLLSGDGPVVIDFPQSVDPARNQNARKLLLRDVGNLHTFVSRFARGFPRRPYAEEMWDLYQANLLTPETTLTGVYRPQTRRGDSTSVESLINDANRDEQRRRASLGLKPGALALKLVEPAPPPVSKYAEKKAAALRKAVEEAARSKDRSPYECTPDGNGSLSRSRCIHEEGSHRVVRGVNERRPSVNERRPTVWWARKRGVRGVLAPAAVLGAHVCRGTRSSHRGGGHGPKSKSCCGGPLAGRMDSR
jgi:RIO kinase 1